MFNPYLNQNLNQNKGQKRQSDEDDMKEFVQTNHFIKNVKPRLQEILGPELQKYQTHKYGQQPDQTQIPAPPKDYKR